MLNLELKIKNLLNKWLGSNVIVNYKLLHPDAKPPYIAYSEDKEGSTACFDLHSVEDVSILPYRHAGVDCGIAFEIPPYYEMILRGRSGHAKKGILMHFGTIDPNFRGVVGAIVYNLTPKEVKIAKGEKVCQVAVHPIPKVKFVEKKELSATCRGDRGFGSSGKF